VRGSRKDLRGSKPKLPSYRPPPEPSNESLLLDDMLLSRPEHDRILASLKKFSNANKQLLGVSRSAAEAVTELCQSSSKVEFMTLQLRMAREELVDASHTYLGGVQAAGKALEHTETVRAAYTTLEVASLSLLLCTGMKAVVLETGKNQTSLFSSVLTSIVTVRDALLGLVQVWSHIPKGKVDQNLTTQLEPSVKGFRLLITALVASRSEQMISEGRKVELEASAQAAMVSVVKLTNSFARPIEKSIVYDTKVASCSISQLWAILNDVTTSPTLVSVPAIKSRIEEAGTDLRTSFVRFMECMKQEVAEPSDRSFTIVKEASQTLRDLLHDIVAQINCYARVSSKELAHEDVDSTLSRFTPIPADLQRATFITQEPEDLVPLPPSVEQKQSLDLPDNYVPDVDPIWEEPVSDEGRLIFSSDGNSIRRGTLNKLITRLTDDLNVNFMKTFITTYRSFTTPHLLLKKIIQRYHVPTKLNEDKTVIQLRCSNLLKHWVETSYADFDEEFFAELCQFLKELSLDSKSARLATVIATSMAKKREEMQNTKQQIVTLTIEEKIPLSPANLLFIFPEEEIARQLTLVDFQIYREILPAELLNQAWSKPKYRYRAKNVLTMISRSTILTRWVSSYIVWQETLKGRIKALTKLISIAEHLFKLNNFNSLMAFLAGFGTSAVYRLKFTREGLTERSKKTLADLENLMSASGSYSNYRTALHEVNPPCVPFLGTYLTDITFIEDGNADYMDGLINYRKREMVYGVIRDIQQYQQQAYAFPMVDGIAHYLTELPSNDEETLYALSLLREPRKTQSADELI